MKELQKDHGMGQYYQIPFILLFFLVGVVCNPNTTQDYPILTVEEINSVHCMGTPQPYEGILFINKLKCRSSSITKSSIRNVYCFQWQIYLLYLSIRKDYSS